MCGFYFFMIHHYKNGLSLLHISVHHCTFSASLHHVKTSPAERGGGGECQRETERRERAYQFILKGLQRYFLMQRLPT